MESQPPQHSETAIAEKCVDRNEKEDDEERNFLSNDELEEYKKVHEVLLKFLTAKPKNKSDLRKSLFNIIASSTRRLAFLEDSTNQETIGTRTQHTISNQQLNSDEYEKFSNPEDEIILRKIKGHLGQNKDEKDEKIPRVIIPRISCNNKPTDTVLYENDNYRMNNKTFDTTSSQYIPVLQENASQTIMKKEEIDDTQLNKEIQIEIECKNVKPSIISIIPEESNISIKRQPHRQNEKISPLKSINWSGKSKKFKACPKKFGKISNFKIHKETDRNIHFCGICGKKFMQKHKLKIHTEVVHNGRIRHKCDTCGKTYVTKKILDHHINSIHNGVTHTCDACGKTFTRKGSLKDHIDSKHKGVTYSCYICEKKFASKWYLKTHIGFVHNGWKSPNCEICGKTFAKSGGLKLHIDSVHKGVKHPCDLCQKVFTQKGYLKKHKDLVHTGITYP